MAFHYHLGSVQTFNAHIECLGRDQTRLWEKEIAPSLIVDKRSSGTCSTHLNGGGPASYFGKIYILSYHTIVGQTTKLDQRRVIFPADEVVNWIVSREVFA